jgi:hypothetical protein
MQKGIWTTLLLLQYLQVPCFALDIVVGKDDCIGVCSNYHKAGADALNAIQDAFTKVRAAGGGRVLMRQGEYIVSSNLIMYSNTALIGDGMDDTIIKLQDFARPWRVNRTARSGLIRSVYRTENKCENLYVAHLTLNGNKEYQNNDVDSHYGRYGYFSEACTNVYLDSVRIERFQGYGFDPHGWKKKQGAPIYGRNLTIVNCVANDNDWDGFTLDQTQGILLRNNTAYNNGRHGFNIVTGSFDVQVINANTYINGYYYYKGTFGCGVAIQNNMLFGTNNVSIVNSTLVSDKRGGVCTNDVFDIYVSNTGIASTRECFNFANTRDVNVSNNICNNTRMFREINVTNIIKINNTVSFPNISSLLLSINNVSFPNYNNNNTMNDTNGITNDDIEGDETLGLCSSGVFNNRVCCLASCGTCGGTMCGSRVGGASGCCQTQIVSSNRYCEDFDAPCIL